MIDLLIPMRVKQRFGLSLSIALSFLVIGCLGARAAKGK